MPVTIYHNPRCNTSRRTLALLREKGVEPQIIEYLKTPYTAAQLKQLLGQMKMPANKLLRKKEAAAAGIDPSKLSEDRADRGDGQEPDHRRAADCRLRATRLRSAARRKRCSRCCSRLTGGGHRRCIRRRRTCRLDNRSAIGSARWPASAASTASAKGSESSCGR